MKNTILGRKTFSRSLKVFYFVCILLFSSPGFAWTETWEPAQVSIGEKAEYKLEIQEGEIQSPEFPAKGIYPDPEAPDLPLWEVLSTEQGRSIYRLSVVYYAPGKFKLPLVWKDSSGKEFGSQAELTVLSSLQQKDKAPEDILPPLEFSGPYGWKLAALLSGLAGLLAGILYAWYFYKTRANRPVDAVIEANPWIQKILIYENRLEELLNSPPIGAREFYRALSGYIRESLSEKLKMSFAHLTEAELFSRIFDSFPINDEEARNWENLLRKAQYSGENAEISQEAAADAWDYWKEVLKS